MMALDMEPFALVEKEGFKIFVAVAAPKYPLPYRTHFSRAVMPEMCDQLRSTIRQLKNAQSISFPTDIWTNTGNNVYIIKPDDTTQNIFTLVTQHFPETRTSNNITR